MLWTCDREGWVAPRYLLEWFQANASLKVEMEDINSLMACSPDNFLERRVPGSGNLVAIRATQGHAAKLKIDYDRA